MIPFLLAMAFCFGPVLLMAGVNKPYYRNKPEEYLEKSGRVHKNDNKSTV